MYNIIKSINYTAKRDLLMVLTIIISIMLPMTILLLSIQLGDVSFSDVTGSYIFEAKMGENYILYTFVIMILTCKAAMGDGGDKTINYEILRGHSRFSIFAARAVSGIFYGAIITIIIFVFPYIFFGLINGWGEEVKMSDALLRIAISIVPTIRVSCMFLFLSFLFSSSGKAMALGYVLLDGSVMLTSMIDEFTDMNIDNFFGASSAMKLYLLENMKEIVVDGEVVNKYVTEVPGDVITKTLIISGIMIIIYLVAAYLIFAKRDKE